MSVKFEKESFRETNLPTGGPVGPGGPGGPGAPPASNREVRHEFAHKIGERLTGGESQTGYLAAYIKQLESNPLRTKMLTSGGLAALQEVLASWIAHDRNRNGHYFTARVPKMAIYGAFVSAPLGHVLIGILQRLFAKRTSLRAKILQILISNLVIAPIQNTVYLASMAVIAGARTFHQIRATVRAGLFPVMKVSWISSPLALAFAQQFLPEQTWVPFFNLVAFVIGTYINAHTKKKRLAALRRKHYPESRDGRDGRDYRDTRDPRDPRDPRDGRGSEYSKRDY
ncbi:MAG: hypothetical protein M1838_002096 [Thelocarpon superellum]|nr:MAG: hypothetical protein M1838_002096 [Thelocarpon superellum]